MPNAFCDTDQENEALSDVLCQISDIVAESLEVERNVSGGSTISLYEALYQNDTPIPHLQSSASEAAAHVGRKSRWSAKHRRVWNVSSINITSWTAGKDVLQSKCLILIFICSKSSSGHLFNRNMSSRRPTVQDTIWLCTPLLSRIKGVCLLA